MQLYQQRRGRRARWRGRSGHPAVGVLSDLYHVTQEGQSYEETREAAPWLRHVHVAGRKERRAPVAEDREFLRSYFAVLKEIGYAGRISIEGAVGRFADSGRRRWHVMREAWERHKLAYQA